MANGPSQRLFGVLLLVIGFVIGWLVHRPAPGKPGITQGVRVHDDGTVTPTQLSIARTDTVTWAANEGAGVQIIFPESGFPEGVKEPPFEGMTRSGTDWAVRCSNDFCFSGNVNGSLPSGRTLTYKYDQVVRGKRTDGMIIIKP